MRALSIADARSEPGPVAFAQPAMPICAASAWSAVALAQFAKTREAGPVSGASVIQLGQAERRVTWADQQAPAQLLPWPQDEQPAVSMATHACPASIRWTMPRCSIIPLAISRPSLPIPWRQNDLRTWPCPGRRWRGRSRPRRHRSSLLKSRPTVRRCRPAHRHGSAARPWP